MKATFIGKNGSMGLIHGRNYNVRIISQGRYIYVQWGLVGMCYCPYSSLKKLQENWELETEKGE